MARLAARVGRAKMGGASPFPTSMLTLFIRDFLYSPLKLVNIDIPFLACYHSHETCCDTIPLSSHLQVEGLKLMLENCKVAEYYEVLLGCTQPILQQLKR